MKQNRRNVTVMTLEEIMAFLEAQSNPADIEGMVRVGIMADKTFGTRVPVLRKLAKTLGKDHSLALELWRAGFRETQILAALVEEPSKVTDEQMEQWAREFTYWEICDQCCMNLFYLLPGANTKAVEWSKQAPEQLKRAGFALMAIIAWKDKKIDESELVALFPYIQQGAKDERAPVKKAVSWALRQIGKRSLCLNKRAIELAEQMLDENGKDTRWVAKDVLRELTSDAVSKRLSAKQK